MSTSIFSVLRIAYELMVDIALETVRRTGRCDHVLIAIVESAHNPPESHAYDLLDPRLHLIAMQGAVRENPDIYGFLFVSMGTVILPIDDHTHSAHPALLHVCCSREHVEARARLVFSDPVRGRLISQPESAPDAVVENYRKVFTGDPLPPALHLM